MSSQAMLQYLLAQGYSLNPPPLAPHAAPAPSGPALPPPPVAPVFPPVPVNPPAAASLAPQPAVPPAPVHLAAFGASGALPVPYQAVSNPAQGVNSFPHIHNVINNNNYANRSEPSGGSLLSSMSAGLAPALPGQLGPTIEQLLERRAREWKPYHNAAEFKEALQDWFTGVLRTYPGDLDRHRAAHEYVTETLSIMEKIGWQKAYEYHKAAFKAGAKIPPLYDPLRHGPIYQFGYITLVHPHLTQPRRFYNNSDSSDAS